MGQTIPSDSVSEQMAPSLLPTRKCSTGTVLFSDTNEKGVEKNFELVCKRQESITPNTLIICHLVDGVVFDSGHAHHVMEVLFTSRLQVYILFTLSSFRALMYL